MMSSARASMLVVNGPPKEAYRTVLVPIDFSAESEAAVHAALAIAPEASITLLHAYEVPFEGLLRRGEASPSAVQDLRLDAHDDALSRLYGLAMRYSWPARQFRSVAVRGGAARAILNEALESGADLIAMARRSRSLLERIFIGSVTRRVLAETQSDVLIANLLPAPRVPS